ncbi:MAG: glucose-6-phosphate isomerase [Anaerolineaceae bacterium]|nr:glucose-6-phosphate isomerase [Anaerolineaceae bacterium]
MELFQPVLAKLNFEDGTIDNCEPIIIRHLGDLQGYFQDEAAFQAMLIENPVLYRVYPMKASGEEAGLLVGTSVIEPGIVGKEYFMTKGHFHLLEKAPEVYFTLSGEGMILIETANGNAVAQKMKKGTIHYIPGKWAHRTINTGAVPLIFFAVWPANAGHNYGAIKDKGFATLVVKGKDGPELIKNPSYH